MTDARRSVPVANFLIVSALLTSSSLLAPPAAAEREAAGAPAPRLAWLGRDRVTFERSTGEVRRYEPLPRPDVWSGLYAGVHAGYAWNQIDASIPYSSVSFDSGILGAHLGYNWNFGGLLLGIEGDIGSGWATATRDVAGGPRLEVETGGLASLRARVGLTTGDMLYYVTGGAAVAQYDVGLHSGLASSSENAWLTGHVLGGGVEMKLTEGLSGRLEVLHYSFDDRKLEFGCSTIHSDLSSTVVRAGLSYRFK